MQISGWLNLAEKTETQPEISAKKTQLVSESKPHANHVMETSTDLEKQAGVDEKQKVLNESSALKVILMVSVMSITILVVNYVTMDLRRFSGWRNVPLSVWKENVRMRDHLKDYSKNLINKFSLYAGVTFFFGASAFVSCAEIKTLFTKKAEIIEKSTFWHWKAGLVSWSIMVLLNLICAGFFAAGYHSLWKEWLAVISTLNNI